MRHDCRLRYNTGDSDEIWTLPVGAVAGARSASAILPGSPATGTLGGAAWLSLRLVYRTPLLSPWYRAGLADGVSVPGRRDDLHSPWHCRGRVALPQPDPARRAGGDGRPAQQWAPGSGRRARLPVGRVPQVQRPYGGGDPTL